MGYGEFGGGGSVDWRVVHENGAGKGGKDNDPAKGGTMAVFVNGLKLAEVDADTSRIVVVWGRHIDAGADAEPAKTNIKMRPYDPGADERPGAAAN